MVGGHLVAHSLVLGRFLDRSLERGRFREFAVPCRDLRAAERPRVLDRVAFLVQLAAGSTLLASAPLGAPSIPAAVVACAPFPILVALHSPTGFDRLEKGLLSGRSQEAQTGRRFLRLNGPIHLADTAVYLGAAVAVAAPGASS